MNNFYNSHNQIDGMLASSSSQNQVPSVQYQTAGGQYNQQRSAATSDQASNVYLTSQNRVQQYSADKAAEQHR